MKKKFTKILGVGLTLALLTSMLLTAAPVSALTQPLVTFATTADSVISAVNADYAIRFELGKELAATDEIIITFPSDTTVFTGAMAAATIQASDGWIGGSWLSATIGGGVTFTGAATTRKVTVVLDGAIGEGAQVRITLPNGITNPSVVASYTLTVGTQTTAGTAIEAAVTSAAYSVTSPTVSALPGIVQVFNPAGVMMTQKTGDTAINDAIAAATSTGYVVKIGPGTYNGNSLDTWNAATAGVTFVATGAAAETIWKGAITIGAASITIDGITITGAVTIGAAGDKATIKNCVISKASSTAGATLVSYGNTVASGTGTITANTIDTSLGTVVDIGIAATQPGLTISGNTFVVDGAAGAEDSAISVTAASGTTTISGNTITGASGIGITINAAGSVTATDNTLSNLNQALNITGSGTGAVTVKTNTIDTCGLAVSTTLTTGQAAIQVVSVGSGGLSITNNTISNCPNDIIEVDANSNLVNMMFNNMTGNTLGVDNDDAAANTLNATHNWWGVATGPATGMNVATTGGGQINAAGYLSATATGTFSLATATVTAATTQKVDVSITTTAGAASAAAIIGVANYASNPGAATPYTALSGGFFDVYIGTPTNTTDVATIKLYGSVTSTTVAYVYSTLQGTWAKCDSQGVNTTTGYVWVKTGATITPSITDLSGTAFALVKTPTAALATPTLTAPTLGTTDVSLSPAFSWNAVTGAKGYEFQLADNANFILPIVNLTGAESALIVPFYKYAADLEYDSTYYWRVKALDVEFVDFVISNSSAWATSVFTTEVEAVEEEAPVWTCAYDGLTFDSRDALEAHIKSAHPAEEPPVIEPIVEVITEENVITPAWIYAIIGVGAVLVIAVIVLIVRTRRVA